jgi:enoyl-CoA hydratase/carnithine racemase
MEFTTFRFSRAGNVATLTLNRPEALNALNSAFFQELNALLDALDAEGSHPVLIITGSGKAFAAGADISEMAGMEPDAASKFSQTGQQAFNRLEAYPLPVIAAVNGFALGGGCELAMACDFRLASEKARFGMPEATLGLIPGYGGTQRLPRLAGMGNALFMLLTATAISADEALRMGLVQEVVLHDQLQETATAKAQNIAGLGPAAIRSIKKVVRKGLSLPFSEGTKLETQEFAPLFADEGRIGMRAFLEKKKPEWKQSK